MTSGGRSAAPDLFSFARMATAKPLCPTGNGSKARVQSLRIGPSAFTEDVACSARHKGRRCPMRELSHFVAGREKKGTSGRFGDVFNPATGEGQARVAFASR